MIIEDFNSRLAAHTFFPSVRMGAINPLVDDRIRISTWNSVTTSHDKCNYTSWIHVLPPFS